jgi:hypothetical protein
MEQKTMNMISTGAFLSEMDASDKQKNSLVNKLVSAWEQKNSKTARAGGVSLMALSLAACGSSDDTSDAVSYTQAQLDAATAAATTAAEAAATTTAATVATATAAATATSVAAATTAAETAAATAAAALKVTTDATLATLQASYDALVAPVSATLTDDDTTGIGPDAPNLSQGDDTITGTNLTFDAGDVIVDSSSTDADSITISAATDLTVTPSVINIETVNINATGTLSSGDTTLAVDLAGFAGATSFNFDSTGAGSLVSGLTLTNADTNNYVASADFTTIAIGADADADIVLTVAANASISTTGTADDLTIHGGGKNVTVTSSTATEDIVVDGAVNTDITAASALGNVTITGTGTSTVTTAAAKGNVSITSSNTITLTSATAAIGTVTVDNTGATAGLDIVITDANSATTFVGTSVGAITATANSGLAAATSITATVAEASTITSDGVTATQTINLNTNAATAVETTVTLNANGVNTLNLGGSTAILASIDGADLGTGATATTVTGSNTAGHDLLLDTGAADVRNVANNVDVRLGVHDASNLTHQSGATFALNADTTQTAIPVFLNAVDATASTANTLNVKVIDVTANTDTTHNTVGLTFTDVQTLNVAIGSNNLTNGTADITGADLESVVVTGTGNVDLAATTITGDATNRVTLDTTALTGSLTMQMDGTTNGVNTITTGGGVDTIALGGIAGSTAGHTLTLGAGADIVSVTTAGDGATAKFTIDGGTGTDTLNLDSAVDISGSTVSLTSVERITVDADATVGSALISGKSLIIGGGANSDITVSVASATVDLSTLAFETAMQDANDSMIVNGSGNALAQTFTGSSIIDTITGGSGADVISGAAGADVLAGGAGNDVLTGGTGADQFTVSGGRDTITGGTGVDNTIITAAAGSIRGLDFDFGGAAANDNLTLTLSATVKDAAGNAGAVSTGVNGGAVVVAGIAVDTAIGAAATGEAFVIAQGADNTAVALSATDATIEAAIAAQLADGAADISVNLATGEGYVGVIANATGGTTVDSYFMYEHIASATGAGVTEAAEINLIMIADGTDMLNVAAGDFI